MAHRGVRRTSSFCSQKTLVATLATVALLAGCSSAATRGASAQPPPTPAPSTAGPGRGFPVAGPWMAYYGSASHVDLARMATSFRDIVVDADPGRRAFSSAQIAQLKAGDRNRVLSYLNIGSVEKGRSYWSKAPPGLVPAGRNTRTQSGPYAGYPDEVWMDASNADWQRLILDYVAPRLAAEGVDGFLLDNLEVVDHVRGSGFPLCSARCRQGALDLVRRLRAEFPDMLIVMNNATGDRTRLGHSGGQPFPGLLDGVVHEETFTYLETPPGTRGAPLGRYRLGTNATAVRQLAAWAQMGLRPGGRPFWVATLDYANSCTAASIARPAYAAARARGFSPYVSTTSAALDQVCYWPAGVTSP